MRDEARFSIDGVEITNVTWGPAHAAALTYGPNVRRLPRLRLSHTGRYWQAKWISQNGSWLAEEATTRRRAVRMVIATARYQRWPLLVPLDNVR